MRSVNFSQEASASFQKLSLKHKKQVTAKIDALVRGELHGTKQLIGFKPLRRARCGDYRIIFTLTEELLSVLLLDDRKRVYKHLRRKF